MILTCTVTGAQVVADEEAAKKLVASGSFAPADEPKPKRAPAKKAAAKKEA